MLSLIQIIGQFITQKLPIALSCHAQLVEIMDGTKREFPATIRAYMRAMA
jgi:hypothetical protein